MQRTEEFLKTVGEESDRLISVLNRLGFDEMIDFSKRTYKIYRKALLSPKHFANKKSNSGYRKSYVLSCLSFRKVIFHKF